jgi:glycosyltransferase involved in cell wall biosynthesis
LKVLLSAFACEPNRGSEPGNGWGWTNHLVNAGHEVTLLTTPRGRRSIESQRSMMGGGLNVTYLPVRSVIGRCLPRADMYLSYLQWQTDAYDAVRRMGAQFDITHHVSWGSLHLGSELWRLPWPLIYGPIGGGQTAPESLRDYFGRGWVTERLRSEAVGRLVGANPFARRTLRRSSMVFVTNLDTAELCARIGVKAQLMLAEGIPRQWIRPDPRIFLPDRPTLLWVGRLLPHKAPLLAIDALNQLPRSLDAQLVIAGDGPLRQALERRVGRLGLNDRVQFLGHVDWSQLPGLYDRASMFMFTSLRDSSGAQYLEAMARGLPAVVLDHHGVGYFASERTTRKVALEPAANLPTRLAEAVTQILSDEEAWRKASASAIAWAARHSWESKIECVGRVYRNVVYQVATNGGSALV